MKAIFRNQQGKSATQKFRNLLRTRIYYSCEVISCEEKQKVGLFAYHSLRSTAPKQSFHCDLLRVRLKIRGITKLGGACGKEQVWRPHVRT